MKRKLLIGVAVLGTVVAVASSLVFARSVIKEGAEREASKFAGKLGIASPTVSCMAADTDDNGYYSCTLFDKARNKMYPVECTSVLTINSGCKMSSNSVVTQ